MSHHDGPGRRVIAAFVGLALVVGSSVAPVAVRASTPATLMFAAELLNPAAPTTGHIILVFDGPLDPFSIPDPIDFVVDVEGVVQSPTAVSIPYVMFGGLLSVVRLDLAIPIDNYGTVDYTPGAHPLKSAGASIDPIVDATVEVFDPGTFEHLFTIIDEGLGRDHALAIHTAPIGAAPLPDPGDFVLTVTPSGGSPTPYPATGIAIVEPFYGVGLLDLTLPLELAFDDQATISYTPGLNPLVDTSGRSAPAVIDGPTFVNVAEVSTHETMPGVAVEVSPADRRTGTQPVALTFDTIETGGQTSLTTDTVGPAVPTGFQLGDPADYFEISTTATFTGTVEVCITYDESAYDPPETTIRLLHFTAGAWSDITTSLDDVANIVCGSTSSFSPFALATRTPYPFAGFFAPVDSSPAYNILKAGATVPIKFSLGGDRGLGILAGNPSSVGVLCPVSATFDWIETTTNSTGGLRYDAAGSQYVYPWKSERSWAGTCRRFTLRLDDGTSHVALFQFR